MVAKRPPSFSTADTALAAALVVFGIAARCRYYLSNPSYWYDEAYTLLNVIERPCIALLGAIRHDIAAPPLFLWLLRSLYVSAGSSEWVMRLPAVAASIAAVLLMVPLARRVTGDPGWLCAVGFCAVSYHGVDLAVQVKQYAGDLLATEVILLAASACLLARVQRPSTWACFAAVTLIAPWISFPSVFVLGGASLALFIEARHGRVAWRMWSLVTVLLVLSSAALWMVSARYLYYPGLIAHWGQSFPERLSPAATLGWAIRTVIHIGDYANTGMGIPLLLLGALGVAQLWSRSPGLAVLLVSPLVFALLAATLRRYPLDDRLVFFAAPCLWLPAAAGAGVVAQRLSTRYAWSGVLILVLLLSSDAARTGKSLIHITPRAAFREAFAHVREQWTPGDTLWVSHPEVYELYFGKDADVLGSDTALEVVEGVARRGRIWMVYTPQGAGLTDFHDVFDRLRAARSVPVQHHTVTGLEIALYQPSEGRR